MKTCLYRASNLKSTITFLASVSWRKSVSADRSKQSFLALFIIIIIIIFINFFRRVFSECTKAMITTSLLQLETILPEECAFIIGFSCTVWTKMRSLAGQLADGTLADHFNSVPTDTAHQHNEGKGSSKVRNFLTQKTIY